MAGRDGHERGERSRKPGAPRRPTQLPNASVRVVAMTFAEEGSPPVQMQLVHNDPLAQPLSEPGRRFQAFFVAEWTSRKKIELVWLSPARCSGIHVAAYLLQDFPVERIQVRGESVSGMQHAMPLENPSPGDIVLGNAMAGSQALLTFHWNDTLNLVDAHVVRSGESAAMAAERILETPLAVEPVLVEATHDDAFLPFTDPVVAHLRPTHP